MTATTQTIELRPNLAIDAQQLAELCQKHHVQTLALFGSALRDDFHDRSDIDLLVEFFPGKTPGLKIIDIQDQLSQLFDRPVDLNTPQDLSRYFRHEILEHARPLYRHLGSRPPRPTRDRATA
ncbi:MAG: nucleotidyltransferase [Oscillatoriales cyanobacterium]|nr:MAG: nucleotidyltransferase [Oscillatoriales cyanobacterium]